MPGQKALPASTPHRIRRPVLSWAVVGDRADDEALALAGAYIRDGAVSEAHRVQRVDVLVSWNFKHIVKLSRIRAYNAVNLKLGHPELEIRSPMEVMIEEE